MMRTLKEYVRHAICESVSPDIEDAMRRRVKDHINRVQYFYKLMCDSGLIPDEFRDEKAVLIHDKDKFEPKNLKRQALRFVKDRTPSMDKQITDVVREHIRRNPHHFEHWGGKGCDQFSKNIDCSSMPLKHVYEMLADWASTAEERGNTVTSFYEKNAGSTFNFSAEQDAVIRECAEFLDSHIDPSLKRQYSEVYASPSKIKQ